MASSINSLYLQNPEAAAAMRRSQLAEMLMQQAQPQGPIRSPMGVLGSMGQTLVAALMAKRSSDDLSKIGADQKGKRDALMAQIMGVMGGGGGRGQDLAVSPSMSPPMDPPPDATPGGHVGPARLSPARMGAVPQDLMPHFQRAATANNIPLDLLVAQARQESGLNPNAVGRAGEVGLMQVMPSTARQPGFGMEPVPPEALRDPAANIDFGARYLRARAGQNADLSNPQQAANALRSYNGGGDPNYVQNVARHLPGTAGTMRQDVTGAPAPGPTQGAPAGRGGNTGEMQRLALMAAMSGDPQLENLAPILMQSVRQEAPRAPMSVAPGSTVFDPNTGRPIFTAPERPREPRDPTAEPLERIVGPNGQPTLVPRSQAMGATPFVPERQPTPLMPPEVLEQQRQLREAGRPSTNVDMRAETAEATGRGRSLAEEGERVRLGGEAAGAVLDTVRHVQTLGAETGRLAGAQEALGGWMDALGIRGAESIRTAKTLQEFNAAASNFVLGKQLEQKGVQSESDAARMRDTFAKITNTTEANDAILRATQAQAMRAMERAEFYQNWRQDHQNSVDGANEAWSRHIRDTPMVARDSEGRLIFAHEYMPAALQHLNGDRERALDIWRQRAARR